MYTRAVVCLLALWGTACLAIPDNLTFTPLDDFEDVSAWRPGDPNTDLQQRDSSVTASTDMVKEGTQSLAFMIRVNWTPRPNEKYAKGWPMMRRTFEQPRDWSGYDYVVFWIYPKTSLSLRQATVLRIGFPSPETDALRHWHTVDGLRPNVWQQVAIPVSAAVDPARVGGVSFYVAEGWYKDGDAVDFFVDDMRLGRRTVPALMQCEVTSRVQARGRTLQLRLQAEGPAAQTRLHCRITNSSGKEQRRFEKTLQSRQEEFLFPLTDLPAGGYHAWVELLDQAGRVVDMQQQYFRVLESGRRAYLKLITFYTRPMDQLDIDSLAVLNMSAYEGVAIPVRGSYYTGPVPTYEELKTQRDNIRDVLHIDPWPWIALNRMIGAPEDGSGHAHSHAKNVDYFLAVKGLDLDDDAGARADFLKLWRLGLQLARDWKSPGVMIDLEAYNNYRAYHVPWLAEERGEPVDVVIAKCKQLGADMAKVIKEEYPQCKVWSLFSRLEHSQAVPGTQEELLTTVSYITLGMLEYARKHNVPMQYICGGETTPGYCNKSVETLKAKIAARDHAVAPYLQQFPERLVLGGTISPFHDFSIVTSFIEKGYKGSDFETIEDFEPMFRTLFDAYDYVWIYASSAAKTMPYKPENNTRYSAVLNRALDAATKGK